MLVIVTLPVVLPVAAGASVTSTVADCPGERIWPADKPPALKPGPAIDTLAIVRFAVPEFVMVPDKVLLAPTLTLPNDKLDGFMLSVALPAAVTLSTTGMEKGEFVTPAAVTNT